MDPDWPQRVEAVTVTSLNCDQNTGRGGRMRDAICIRDEVFSIICTDDEGSNVPLDEAELELGKDGELWSSC